MLLHSQRVERLKLWTSLVNFHLASPRNTATQRTNFTPFLSNHVISNFSFFFSSLFSFLSRFYLIVYAFFLPKIWNYRQRSFSLPFKLRNLHRSLNIRHVDLRTSRILCPYLGSVSICWIIIGNIWRYNMEIRQVKLCYFGGRPPSTMSNIQILH